MSSSESDDEDLERLMSAVAPDFCLRSTSKTESATARDPSASLTAPSALKFNGGNSPTKLSISVPSSISNGTSSLNRNVTESKPSLRPDKQKQTISADALDLDGFTPQFKAHLSKKLGSKLDLEIGRNEEESDEEDGEERGGNGELGKCSLGNGHHEIAAHDGDDDDDDDDDCQTAISIFSSSKKTDATSKTSQQNDDQSGEDSRKKRKRKKS